MQKEFINIASHEMKTPTRAILGFTELVVTHPDKSGEMKFSKNRPDSSGN
jgi:signal transduction histidine kinase